MSSCMYFVVLLHPECVEGPFDDFITVSVLFSEQWWFWSCADGALEPRFAPLPDLEQ